MTELNLSQFTCTDNYWRHPFSKSVYTDGVKYFADKAKAYWFLDIVFTEYDILQRANGFIVIKLTVNDGKADINVTDGNDFTMKSRHIDFTDCPEGDYTFFFTNNVLLLNSEY